MAIYRLLNQQGYSPDYWRIGHKYASEYEWHGVYTHQLVKSFPADWELVKENTMCTEKTIKLSLDQAKKMYGKNPEMDELLLANFSKEELTKKELPKSWAHLESITGFFTDSSSRIKKASKGSVATRVHYENKNTFVTEKQANSALAMAQLSQLMAVYNDGWEPDWKDLNFKYIISSRNGKIICGTNCSDFQFLAFKSTEFRNEFFANFEPLIKQYFMID